MAKLKPVIFTVDDDPEVLRAIERDLRSQYGSAYRVMRAESAASALETLKQLKLRNEPVALLVSDQKMPEVNGVEFLAQAMLIYPEAKKVLLTAYADTDAAIKAINKIKIDYYFLKPWDPPQDNLYPVVSDLLEDWEAHNPVRDRMLQVVGHRWSALSHQAKEFLGRNQVPYLWKDLESDHEAARLLTERGYDLSDLPLVILENGTIVKHPTNIELGQLVGMQNRAEMPFYHLAIIGSGPAGLAAAVYGASEGLQTVLIEREAPGGQAGTSSRIENYLGFPSGLSGADLARRGVAQARRFGVEILTPQEVVGVQHQGNYKVVKLADGGAVTCQALMIATGVSYRKLEVDGIEQLTGAGVYYGAAMTEAINCRDEDVYIVGGANSAGQAAMYFSKFATKVVMVVRGPSLAKSMSQYLIDQISGTPNIEVRVNASVTEVCGQDKLERIKVRNVLTGETETVPASSMFIFIGALPQTDFLDQVVERDAQGFILAGPDIRKDGKLPKSWTLPRDPYLLETSVPGIFVAGDVRYGSVKRVASGVGEGSIAVQFIHRYLAEV